MRLHFILVFVFFSSFSYSQDWEFITNGNYADKDTIELNSKPVKVQIHDKKTLYLIGEGNHFFDAYSISNPKMNNNFLIEFNCPLNNQIKVFIHPFDKYVIVRFRDEYLYCLGLPELTNYLIRFPDD